MSLKVTERIAWSFPHGSGMMVKSYGCHKPSAAELGADAAGTSDRQARRLCEAEQYDGE
jgi:hypothetical protein